MALPFLEAYNVCWVKYSFQQHSGLTSLIEKKAYSSFLKRISNHQSYCQYCLLTGQDGILSLYLRPLGLGKWGHRWWIMLHCCSFLSHSVVLLFQLCTQDLQIYTLLHLERRTVCVESKDIVLKTNDVYSYYSACLTHETWLSSRLCIWRLNCASPRLPFQVISAVPGVSRKPCISSLNLHTAPSVLIDDTDYTLAIITVLRKLSYCLTVSRTFF